MTKAQEFRESMKELLELISSKAQQLQYENNVPVANVSADLLCMWFDDMYHPYTELFTSAFNPTERRLLESFNNDYELLSKDLPETLGEFHKNSDWALIMSKAKRVLNEIQW